MARHGGFLSPGPTLVVLVLLFPGILASTPPNGAVTAARTLAGEPDRGPPVAGFRRADALRLRMYREADPSLARLAFTSGGTAAATVIEEVGRLRRMEVEDRTLFTTLDLASLGAGLVTARVRQKVIVVPRFLDRAGRDITSGGPQLQVIVWELRAGADGWLIDSGRVVSARPFEYPTETS